MSNTHESNSSSRPSKTYPLPKSEGQSLPNFLPAPPTRQQAVHAKPPGAQSKPEKVGAPRGRGGKVDGSDQTKALDDIVERLSELQQTIASTEILSSADLVPKKLSLARLLLEVIRDPNRKYGEKGNAIEEAAAAAHLSKEELYRHAKVAKVFSVEDVTALLEKAKGKDTPVSWSHLVYLARAKSPEVRESIIESVLTDRLSADQTNALVTQHVRVKKDAPPMNMARILGRLTRLDALARSLTEKVRILGEEIPAVLGSSHNVPAELAEAERKFKADLEQLTTVWNTSIRPIAPVLTKIEASR